jgi:transcriptional regulator with XRE-family HTH domain
MAEGRGMGARIRARRADVGVTQAALAAEVGISAPYLNLIEHERRRIGGRLLVALARALGVEPVALTEGAGAGLVADLGAAAGLAAGSEVELPRAAEFAARYPGWAGLVVGQHRRLRRLEETIETLSDRLTHDPRLAASLHEVLSTVTAIRSTAAILNETRDLDRDWLDRFHRNIDEDGRRLAISARALVAYLDGEGDGGGPGASIGAGAGAGQTPQEEFEVWLATADAGGGGRARNGATLPETAEARALAEAWLAQSAADAAAIPLAALAPTLAGGLDPVALAVRLGVPVPALFRRLAALPGRPGGYGLLTCDAAGAFVFRRPCEGFLMPRLGAACPLWPLFEALSRVMQPVSGLIEQSARMPRRFRVWAVAAPRTGGAGGFVAHMLMRPALPDETGPDAGPVTAVGTTCRVCPRQDCPARREASVLPG